MPAKLLCLTLFLVTSLTLSAQTVELGYYGITCETRDTAENAYLPPISGVSEGGVAQRSRFILDFADNVPQAARSAMLFAADVWGAYLISEVPVRVSVDWEDRDDDRLLASAGPGTLFRGFPGSEPETWYPVALAESITGRALNDDADPDIRINANSTANWYFGTDGNTPRNRIDLASVILHELGHGLGFLSSVDTISPTELEVGFGGRFIIYDLFLETEGGVPLTDESMFTNPSDALLRAVSRNNLVWDGPNGREAFGDVIPLYAPPTFDVGSSVSHLSETVFRPGTENALMTPFLSAGEAVHDPGPLTLGIFADMGWGVELQPTSVRSAGQVNISVFPNPATDRVRVELGRETTTRDLQLYASDGRRVRSLRVTPGSLTQEMDVRDLTPGYYVLVGSGSATWRQALVVR